ncbi:hypothetical protein DVJ83_08165 [Deinococcus wulumuqiensis]|uniref:Uncharacterized protein n=1 Tax=Deinococcus wulumuqiensis TaxID=980427 RepID=A0A345IHH0_9DEIO|nr:hypothetical protein DVJ83_08165 [Deinococcus wulumuqiensis]
MHRRRFPDCAGIKRNPYNYKKNEEQFSELRRRPDGAATCSILHPALAFQSLDPKAHRLGAGGAFADFLPAQRDLEFRVHDVAAPLQQVTRRAPAPWPLRVVFGAHHHRRRHDGQAEGLRVGLDLAEQFTAQPPTLILVFQQRLAQVQHRGGVNPCRCEGPQKVGVLGHQRDSGAGSHHAPPGGLVAGQHQQRPRRLHVGLEMGGLGFLGAVVEVGKLAEQAQAQAGHFTQHGAKITGQGLKGDRGRNRHSPSLYRQTKH